MSSRQTEEGSYITTFSRISPITGFFQGHLEKGYAVLKKIEAFMAGRGG